VGWEAGACLQSRNRSRPGPRSLRRPRRPGQRSQPGLDTPETRACACACAHVAAAVRPLSTCGRHLVRAHLLDRVGVEHALEDEAEKVVAPARRGRGGCREGCREGAERVRVAGAAVAREGVAARRRRGAAHCSSCSLATAMSALTASAVSSLSMASLILRPMARFSSSNSSSSSSPSRSPLAFSTCGRQSS
jgi:hypothetical protein